MNNFNPKTQADLISHLKHPDLFIEIYDKIVRDLNGIEEDFQDKTPPLNMNKLVKCEKEEHGVRFTITNVWRDYGPIEGKMLHQRTWIAIEQIVNPNFLRFMD